MSRTFSAAALAAAALSGLSPAQEPVSAGAAASSAATFDAPIRLEADGEPIDIGKLSRFGHAGPWFADVDGDGDRDLLVGDFPGHFWLFDNEGEDTAPKFMAQGKWQAGGEDAKTPVY